MSIPKYWTRLTSTVLAEIEEEDWLFIGLVSGSPSLPKNWHPAIHKLVQGRIPVEVMHIEIGGYEFSVDTSKIRGFSKYKLNTNRFTVYIGYAQIYKISTSGREEPKPETLKADSNVLEDIII